MLETLMKALLTITVPIAGAIGYVHGTFATIDRVERLETKTDKTRSATLKSYKLICKMAIRQQLENAEDICTE